MREVNLVAAMKCEAEPLLRHFSLEKSPRVKPFLVYGAEGLRLVLSGVGKLAAAAAVGYLCALTGGKAQAWLNIGVAGHREHEVGQGFLAHKVTDAGTGESWFPRLECGSAVKTAAVLTVDRPENAFRESALYDMEAAGFYAAASLVCPASHVHCYKIVSDNLVTGLKGVNPAFVSRLAKQHVEVVESLVVALRSLPEPEARAEPAPPELDPFLARWGFTIIQKRRLHRLLGHWRTLSGEQSMPLDELGDPPDAEELLRRIEAMIDALLP